LAARPGLAVLAGWVHALRGRPAQADGCAELAVRTLEADPAAGREPAVRPRLALLEAALCRHGVERMGADAAAATASFELGSAWRPKSLLLLGWTHLLVGRDREADELFREAELTAGAGTTNTAAVALASRALLAFAAGQSKPAARLSDQSIAALDSLVMPTRATSTICYAVAARAAVNRDDRATVNDHLYAAERLLPQLTYALPWMAISSRLELARVRLALGEIHGAAVLLREAREILRHRPQMGLLVRHLAEVERHLHGSGGHDLEGWPGSLTGAEMRLLPLLTTHLTFGEIAQELYLSRSTVKSQAASTYRKLGVASRCEAIRRAVNLGLIDGRLVYPPE
jgi:LuxR family maltose regulon positive regulatory protein